jgi:hypothetical protein
MPRMAQVKKSKKPPAAKKKPAAKATRKPAAKATRKPAKATRKPAAKATRKPAAKATRKPAARARGVSVGDYVAGRPAWQKRVIAQLREILREGAPGATEEIKQGHPVYDWNGPFAHIAALPETVNLGFWRGASLSDPLGLLSGKSDRMKHVEITAATAVVPKAIVALVREAVRLNDELGDPTRR